MSNYKLNNPDQLAIAFKALSNPNRLQIFLQLLSCCEPGTECNIDAVSSCCVGDLGANLEVAPSTLSHHVKELQHAGLITTHRKGKNIECAVDTGTLAQLREFFNTHGDSCCLSTEMKDTNHD